MRLALVVAAAVCLAASPSAQSAKDAPPERTVAYGGGVAAEAPARPVSARSTSGKGTAEYVPVRQGPLEAVAARPISDGPALTAAPVDATPPPRIELPPAKPNAGLYWSALAGTTAGLAGFAYLFFGQ